MSRAPIHGVLDYLHRAARLQEAADAPDADLLGRYVVGRDGDAFEALVRRHGPMVLAVCRRLLPNAQDAEDAFQAVFLVLVRKAASVRPRDRLAAWLHGVARNAALKARQAANRRRAREKQVPALPDAASVEAGLWNDLAPLLDREVGRLPEKYRLPVVLCDLEGKTRTEAAQQLGWPEGTVAGRLARARALLARRMTGQGVPASAGVLAAVLSQGPARSAVPVSLLFKTVKAAAGVRPAAASVAVITQGVIRAMLWTRLKVAAAVTAAASALCGGAVVLAWPAAGARKDAPPAAARNVGERDAAETNGPAPSVSVKFLGKRGGKPPAERYDLALEMTNPRDHPVWLLLPYYGDEVLPDKGVFKSNFDQPFGGEDYDGGPNGGEGKAVEIHFLGDPSFRAFRLPAKAKVAFARFGVETWSHIARTQFAEASSLRVNDRTPLEEWLPYATLCDRTASIPAGTDWRNKDWDPAKLRSRTDYPKEVVKTVTAVIERKWFVLIPPGGDKDNP
jgi:RNA polymerase sigma factor (sigma-70 family)